MSSRSLAELKQVDRTSGQVKVVGIGLWPPASSRFTFGHGVRGDPATYPL
jgi:hypothetical protein